MTINLLTQHRPVSFPQILNTRQLRLKQMAYFTNFFLAIGKNKVCYLMSLVDVGRLFLAVPWGCLRFMIVVFPDHTHLIFMIFNEHRPRADDSHEISCRIGNV